MPMGVLKMKEELTDLEWTYATLISRGFSNAELAEYFLVEIGTVRNHIYTIFKKLGVNNRVKLARLVWEHEHQQRFS